MLDAFLETVCGHTKQAEARRRQVTLLEQLPTVELHKIASGSLAMPKEAGEESWLEKFQGTPLLDRAIAIEKEDLDIQMEEASRRQAERAARASAPSWEDSACRQDELRIKRKLLELELVGADVSGGPEEAIPEEGGEEPPVDLEAVESAAMPPVPKAAPPGVGGPPAPPPAHAAPAVPVAAEEEEEPPLPAADVEEGPPPAPKPKAEEKKPATTKVTKETTEKPAEDKIDIKAAAAKMRFSLAIKEAQPANRARAFRR